MKGSKKRSARFPEEGSWEESTLEKHGAWRTPENRVIVWGKKTPVLHYTVVQTRGSPSQPAKVTSGHSPFWPSPINPVVKSTPYLQISRQKSEACRCKSLKVYQVLLSMIINAERGLSRGSNLTQVVPAATQSKCYRWYSPIISVVLKL